MNYEAKIRNELNKMMHLSCMIGRLVDYSNEIKLLFRLMEDYNDCSKRISEFYSTGEYGNQYSQDGTVIAVESSRPYTIDVKRLMSTPIFDMIIKDNPEAVSISTSKLRGTPYENLQAYEETPAKKVITVMSDDDFKTRLAMIQKAEKIWRQRDE